MVERDADRGAAQRGARARLDAAEHEISVLREQRDFENEQRAKAVRARIAAEVERDALRAALETTIRQWNESVDGSERTLAMLGLKG